MTLDTKISLRTQNMSLYFQLTITATLHCTNLTISIKNIYALTNFIFVYKKRFCTLFFSKLKEIKNQNL